MPKLRRAAVDDFDAIYNIWMQEDVNPFMTFEILDKEAFRPIFTSLYQGSDIYVIEDENGQVVATRRIIFGRDECAHTVEFASFGVDKEHRGKGYGKFFYEAFIELLKETKPDIKRIIIGQETDNMPAFELAKKKGFCIEAIFPDWIPRETGLEMYRKKWNMGARFMAFMLDEEVVKQAKDNVDNFTPLLPSLNNNLNQVLSIKQTDNKFICFYNEKPVLTCIQNNGVRRFGHIQFWKLIMGPHFEATIAEAFLRKLAEITAEKYKKVEVHIATKDILNLAKNLGFHFRGKTIASCKIDDVYYNEVAADLSFFNIADAKKLLAKLDGAEEYKMQRILSALNQCRDIIRQEADKGQIDDYGKLYLENLAFQMIREGLGETQLYTKDNAPWRDIITNLSAAISSGYIKLAKLINPEFSLEQKCFDKNQPAELPVFKY